MIKQTNILFFISALLLLGFIGCKKSSTGGSSGSGLAIGTIAVSIDGTNTTFNFGAKASTLAVTGGYGIRIKGNKKDPSQSSTSLTIEVVRGTPITTGTYVENISGSPLVTMDYFLDIFFGVGNTASAYGSASNKVTVTITEITSTYVKGTFSGELQGPGITTPTVKTVMSNGEFYVSF